MATEKDSREDEFIFDDVDDEADEFRFDETDGEAPIFADANPSEALIFADEDNATSAPDDALTFATDDDKSSAAEGPDADWNRPVCRDNGGNEH